MAAFPAIYDLRESLRMHNYVKVPFPVPRSELVLAAEAFTGFLTLSPREKQRFHFKLCFHDGNSDIGYSRPGGKNGKDDKEYFHYHPLAEWRFGKLPLFGDSRVRTFFDHGAKIFDAAQTTLDHVLNEFEKVFPGIHDRFMVEHVRRRFYLRFLKYDAKGKGKFLARAHFDRGGATIAIAESAPGLRIGWNSIPKSLLHLEEVKHEDHSAIFFPSYHFPRLTGPEFEPAWHDVVQSSDDQYSEDTARWAIVFFADVYGLPLPSEKVTHQPWPGLSPKT